MKRIDRPVPAALAASAVALVCIASSVAEFNVGARILVVAATALGGLVSVLGWLLGQADGPLRSAAARYAAAAAGAALAVLAGVMGSWQLLAVAVFGLGLGVAGLRTGRYERPAAGTTGSWWVTFLGCGSAVLALRVLTAAGPEAGFAVAALTFGAAAVLGRAAPAGSSFEPAESDPAGDSAAASNASADPAPAWQPGPFGKPPRRVLGTVAVPVAHMGLAVVAAPTLSGAAWDGVSLAAPVTALLGGMAAPVGVWSLTRRAWGHGPTMMLGGLIQLIALVALTGAQQPDGERLAIGLAGVGLGWAAVAVAGSGALRDFEPPTELAGTQARTDAWAAGWMTAAAVLGSMAVAAVGFPFVAVPGLLFIGIIMVTVVWADVLTGLQARHRPR
ncbi:MAG: hypothetical protein CSA58_01705 [Micrococcales bacterium]|nr:MAG: hypothetical protein CSB46_09045 [Micrococcales bacterium]PIE27927.1 MAG: hypothetical protein CSA58_01705 [Micrococcales bacterium]